ncbi:MAG: hypothetical protein ACYC5J_16655 [Chloroflexota bacterium]
MAVQRGVVYDYQGRSPQNIGLLVLTSDLWNEGMIEVGAIPLTKPEEEGLFAPVLLTSPRLRAWTGRLLMVEQQRLTAALFKLSDDNLALVEDALCQILSLADLCSESPSQPPTPAGRIDYPRWSEIYYSKELIGREHKRYAVASNDRWNRATRTAVVVRTTTQPSRHAPGFPAIQGGNAKACCGNAAAVPADVLQLSPYARPQPPSLSFKDMVTIAREIVVTHQLEGALGRVGIA